VVREVVGRLRELIRLQFRWAALSPETLSALPTSFLSAQLKATGLERFAATWAVDGVLCSVVEPAEEGSYVPVLDLRLSLLHPVPAPLEEAA
jgi:hypothetical protein